MIVETCNIRLPNEYYNLVYKRKIKSILQEKSIYRNIYKKTERSTSHREKQIKATRSETQTLKLTIFTFA